MSTPNTQICLLSRISNSKAVDIVCFSSGMSYTNLSRTKNQQWASRGPSPQVRSTPGAIRNFGNRPKSIKTGPDCRFDQVWTPAGGQFANMVKRHLANKLKYPDRPVTYAIPYDGNESLRPDVSVGGTFGGHWIPTGCPVACPPSMVNPGVRWPISVWATHGDTRLLKICIYVWIHGDDKRQ